MSVVDTGSGYIHTYGQRVADDACARCAATRLNFSEKKCEACGEEWPVRELSELSKERLEALRAQCRQEVDQFRERVRYIERLKAGKPALGTEEEWETTQKARDARRLEELGWAISNELGKRS